ncbi:MAG: hypothetical protein K2N69_06140, partial [Helicobacter sp.]|nr:hypothetical protein [Helicobacter sp.]
GESKIVIFKAALCCGFAIALRALFLGILSYSPSLAEGVRGWVVMLRQSRNILSLREALVSWQSTVCEARIMKDSMPLDCFGCRQRNDEAWLIATSARNTNMEQTLLGEG